MYVKLILRNAVRSIKDYLVYIVTMTLCVAMFYAFMSITSRYYNPDVGVQFDLTLLIGLLKVAVLGITCLIIFLVNYVNRFMIQRRQREFALQTIMGMERKTTAGIFFAETLCMGIFSLVIGIILGGLLSQFITAMLLSAFGKPYKMSWMLFPDTIGLTTLFFILCFSIIGIWNIWFIKKIPIVDMLTTSKKNETDIRKNKWMVCTVILYLFLLVRIIGTVWGKLSRLYDAGQPFPVKIMVIGNMLAPVIAILVAVMYGIVRNKRMKLKNLVKILWVTVIPLMGFLVLIPRYKIEYILPMGANEVTQYMLYMVGEVAFWIFATVYLVVCLISSRKEKGANKYIGDNLFFYGQILSRLQTAMKSMIIISLTLTFSVSLFMVEPIMTGIIKGYLNMRAVFDVQISSYYEDVQKTEELPREDYAWVIDYLQEHQVGIEKDCLVSVYFLNRDEFYNQKNYALPSTAISISDYNRLCSMRGMEEITLGEGEFLTQWNVTETQETVQSVLAENKEISTDAGMFKLAENGVVYADIGEQIYNSYVFMIYVLPDEACEQLLEAGKCRFLNTRDPIPYEVAINLQDSFEERYDVSEGGVSYCLRTRSEQISQSMSGYFVTKVSMIYGAIILMISCFTILALQQLSEAHQFGYRFGVLRKLGVEGSRVNSLVRKQIAFWFGIPLVVAFFATSLIVGYVILAYEMQIQAYIGQATLFMQLGSGGVILLVLLICYFTSTWLLFKRSIEHE